MRILWRRARRTRSSRQAADLAADEAAAFLAGRHLEWLTTQHRQPSLGACINPLAHRTRSDLEALAGRPRRPEAIWGVLSYLAGEVLRTADRTGVSVLTIQRTALLPLEMRYHRALLWPDGRPVAVLTRAVLDALRTGGQLPAVPVPGDGRSRPA